VRIAKPNDPIALIKFRRVNIGFPFLSPVLEEKIAAEG
jgi:hypothetical protein